MAFQIDILNDFLEISIYDAILINKLFFFLSYNLELWNLKLRILSFKHLTKQKTLKFLHFKPEVFQKAVCFFKICFLKVLIKILKFEFKNLKI